VTAVAIGARRRVRTVLSSRLTLLVARLVVIAAVVAAWQLGTQAADSPFFLPP